MKFLTAIGTSLSVMISNNLISMFALDRLLKYIMYAVTAEKLKISLGNILNYLICLYQNTSKKLDYFSWNEVEKINFLQVIAEFTDDE